MKTFLKILLLTSFLQTGNALAALAQERAASDDPRAHVHGNSVAPYCGTDFESFTSPERHAAVQALHETRRIGGLARVQPSLPPEIGDVKNFRVNWSDPARPFVLKDISALYYLWVDERELNIVTDEVVEQLRTAMLDQTPPASFNPGQGFLANNYDLFGRPEGYDDDEVINILLFDIPNPLVFGYVDFPELNEADVLYVDSRQHLNEFSDPELFLAVVAHEHAHLIHLNYLYHDGARGRLEGIFILEGLAVFAMIANGYGRFSFSTEYLDHADELSSNLMSFRNRNQHPTTFRRDYSRAGLFHTYIASRFGMSAPADLMRNLVNAVGAENFEQVLTQYGSSFKGILEDFHLANFLNAPDLDERYGYVQTALDPRNGYALPALQTIRIADTPAAFAWHEDGTAAIETEEARFRVFSGGVSFHVWENVEDLVLTLDVVASESAYDQHRNRLRVHVIQEFEGDSMRILPLGPPSPIASTLSGRFERITVAVVHSETEVPPVQVSIAAQWRSLPVAAAEVDLPEYASLAPAYPNPFWAVATIPFEVRQPVPVTIAVYDVLGRRLRTLVEGMPAPGNHTALWNGRNEAGEQVSSGMYLARLQVGSAVQTKSMLLVR